MRVRISALAETIRQSLFLVPMAGVLAGIVLGQLSILLDTQLEQGTPGTPDLPLGLTSTVESARAVLTTIAGATVTVAGIAFSVSLLVIQLGSSQYSPRVVHTLFRDPFNKRVMGVVLGTFTYCLVVLRSVRSAIEEGGTPVIPNLSVSIGLLLGIAAVLAIVAFINHSAHSMDISVVLGRVSRNAISEIHDQWLPDEPASAGSAHLPPAHLPAHDVRFDRSGWVQQVDSERLLSCAPASGTIFLDILPGRYAIAGTRVCTISPPPADIDEAERVVLATIRIGETRTTQQDASYGLRMLVDVALKALSPGINDPTTAQDAIFHATAVLGEALRRYPPARVQAGEGGRRLVLQEQHTDDELVRLTFDEVRRAATTQPTVCIYLLEALALLRDALASAHLDDRAIALIEEARLVVRGCERADLLPEDIAQVRAAYDKRFGPRPTDEP
ncbi:MAG: DUF2254 domain-containing protein [Acidimicrobiales bacterium]